MHTESPEMLVKQVYERLLSQDKKFSLRYLARKVGFKSHSAVAALLSGKKCFLPQHVDSFAVVLKMNDEEEALFRCMVMLRAARNKDESVFYENRLKNLQQRGQNVSTVVNSPKQDQLLRSWIHGFLVTALKIYDTREDLLSLGGHLVKVVSPEEISIALDTLIQSDAVRVEENGKLRAVADIFRSQPDRQNLTLGQYQKSVFQLLVDLIDKQERDRRTYKAAMVCVPKGCIPLIRDHFEKWLNQLVQDFQFFKQPENGDATLALVGLACVDLLKDGQAPTKTNRELKGKTLD